MISPMFDSQRVPGGYLPAPPPVPVDGSGRSAFARSQDQRNAAAISRDSEFLRRRNEIQRATPQTGRAQNSASTDLSGEVFTPENPHLPSRSSIQFLAQQIGQETANETNTENPRSAQLRAEAAIGQYLAAPASAITYDGPQIELDITV